MTKKKTTIDASNTDLFYTGDVYEPWDIAHIGESTPEYIYPVMLDDVQVTAPAWGNTPKAANENYLKFRKKKRKEEEKKETLDMTNHVRETRDEHAIEAAAIPLAGVAGPLAETAVAIAPTLAPGTAGGNAIGNMARDMLIYEGLNHGFKTVSGTTPGEQIRNYADYISDGKIPAYFNNQVGGDFVYSLLTESPTFAFGSKLAPVFDKTGIKVVDGVTNLLTSSQPATLITKKSISAPVVNAHRVNSSIATSDPSAVGRRLNFDYGAPLQSGDFQPYISSTGATNNNGVILFPKSFSTQEIKQSLINRYSRLSPSDHSVLDIRLGPTESVRYKSIEDIEKTALHAGSKSPKIYGIMQDADPLFAGVVLGTYPAAGTNTSFDLMEQLIRNYTYEPGKDLPAFIDKDGLILAIREYLKNRPPIYIYYADTPTGIAGFRNKLTNLLAINLNVPEAVLATPEEMASTAVHEGVSHGTEDIMVNNSLVPTFLMNTLLESPLPLYGGAERWQELRATLKELQSLYAKDGQFTTLDNAIKARPNYVIMDDIGEINGYGALYLASYMLGDLRSRIQFGEGIRRALYLPAGLTFIPKISTHVKEE